VTLNDTLGNPVPVKCTATNCEKFDRCKLKYWQNMCEFWKEIKEDETV
jgi:hypothetical protein